MRVRVEQTVDVPDWWRRAIRAHYGQEGLATREEVRAWIISYGTSEDDDLAAEWHDETNRREGDD